MSQDPLHRLISLNEDGDPRIPIVLWQIFNFLLSFMVFVAGSMRRRDPQIRFHPLTHRHTTARPVRFWGWVDSLDGDRPVAMHVTWAGMVTVVNTYRFPARVPDEFEGAPPGAAGFVIAIDTSTLIKIAGLEVELASGARHFLGFQMFYVPWRYRQFPRALPPVDRTEWCAKHEPVNEPQVLDIQPVFSILIRVRDASPEEIRRSVASIEAQTYPEHELLLVAGVGNDGLVRASGEWIALLDAGIRLAPGALQKVADACVRHDPDLIYGDEDIEASGEFLDPYFKPAYSPDLVLSRHYMGAFLLIRTTALRRAGGLRDRGDHDLVLRVLEVTNRVAHLPRILAHGKRPTGPAPRAWDRGLDAVREAIQRRGIDAAAERGELPMTFRVRRRIRGTPRVSVIIPFRDHAAMTRACVHSILEKTTYSNFDILMIDNGSKDPCDDPRVRTLRCDIPFNYSILNNIGARETTGEHLIFLNNDTEILAPQWIEALLEHSQRPDVGVVGGRLLYPDGTLQHAGVVLGLRGFAGHWMQGMPRDTSGAAVVRNVTAVTGACMMTKRRLFLDVGGFEERLPVAYNDVDLSLRMRARGLLNVYTPYCEIRHHESSSRGADADHRSRLRAAAELRLLRERHEQALTEGDPYYNPNLTIGALDGSPGDPAPSQRGVRVMHVDQRDSTSSVATGFSSESGNPMLWPV